MKKLLVGMLLIILFLLSGCVASSTDSNSMAEGFNVEKNDTGITITKYIGDEAIIDIPEKINGVAVTQIGDRTFENCNNIEKVAIPSSVNIIGAQAFMDCLNLYSIEIPSTVNWIGTEAFFQTKWLNEQKDEFVVVGNNILIKYNGTSVENVAVPDNVRMMVDTFGGMHALRSVQLPEGLEVIGQNTFNYCLDLQAIEFPESLERIEFGAFQNCVLLKTLAIPQSVISIEEMAFTGCTSLKSVRILNSETIIADNAFAYTTAELEY